MKQNFTKGEIINVNLGTPPKEIKGHEQGFERPCVIIKSFNNLDLAVVVPLTTKEAKYSLFTIVKILKQIDGLENRLTELKSDISNSIKNKIEDFYK